MAYRRGRGRRHHGRGGRRHGRTRSKKTYHVSRGGIRL